MQSDHDILIGIQKTVEDMSKRLFGDGQPGELATIKTRLRALEKHRWILYGGALVIAVATGVLGSDLLDILKAP